VRGDVGVPGGGGKARELYLVRGVCFQETSTNSHQQRVGTLNLKRKGRVSIKNNKKIGQEE